VIDAKLIIQISRGLIRGQRPRRTLMFYGVLTALVMLFSGSTFLAGILRDRPFAFLIFWAACAWITLLSVLLAIYDIAKVRADAKRQRRELEASYFRKDSDERHDDPDSH
jgi:hypothetical protein